MALITIVVVDTPAGPQMQIFGEPMMPTNFLDGEPTAAQTVAAVMLNAVHKEQEKAKGRTVIELD